jgi:hypothetical protein
MNPRQPGWLNALTLDNGFINNGAIELTNSYTTAQNAHLGLPAVSNSNGRLVRATGYELSQVWLSAMPHMLTEVTLGRLKAVNKARYSVACWESALCGGLAP